MMSGVCARYSRQSDATERFETTFGASVDRLAGRLGAGEHAVSDDGHAERRGSARYRWASVSSSR
jgi:hypothetical protein